MLRSDVKCAEFIAEMMQFNTDMFLFVDQTGSDRKNSIKKFDYGLKGIANFKKNNIWSLLNVLFFFIGLKSEP